MVDKIKKHWKTRSTHSLRFTQFQQLDIYMHWNYYQIDSLWTNCFLNLPYSFDHDFLNIKGNELRTHYDYTLTNVQIHIVIKSIYISIIYTLKHFFFSFNKQILAVILATIGAIMSLRTLENSFDNNHQRLGLALYAAMWLQFLTGIFKPSR